MPVDSDFKVEWMLTNQEDWERFIKILKAKKKARVHLAAHIHQKDQLCVSYQAVCC